MQRKVTPAQRLRQKLMDSVADAGESFSGYCQLAAQAMLQAALEHEAAEFIGRTSYQRREADQAAYRNGYKKRTVATGEGAVELHLPLNYAVTVDVAKRWRGIRIAPADLEKLNALRTGVVPLKATA